VDHPVTNNPSFWPPIIIENTPWQWGAFPSSPDSVLGGAAAGFPEGTLKAIAMSGLNGSQYVTNPGQLQYPLHGVTYVDLPNGGIWIGPDFGEEEDPSVGILVVHNVAHDAQVKNSEGLFKGIMIVDDYIHCHQDVLGIVFNLTPNPPGGNVIGNSTGWIYFSRQAIRQAIHMMGSDQKVEVLAYWE
jgi:hypothetical protein